MLISYNLYRNSDRGKTSRQAAAKPVMPAGVRLFLTWSLAAGLGLMPLVTAASFAGDETSRPGQALNQTAPVGLNESGQRGDGSADYFSRYLLGQAQAALDNQRYDLAADFVNRALESHPQDRELLVLAAEIAAKLEKWPVAEERLNQVLALTPNDGPALAGRGLARWRQGRTGAAAEDLGRALAEGSLDGQLRIEADQALADIKAGRPAPAPGADDESDQARIDEDWSMVVVMEERGDWDWLDRFYTRLLRHSSESGSYAYAARGFARLSQGREADAEQDFAAALSRTDLDPQTRKSVLGALDRLRAVRQPETSLQEEARLQPEARLQGRQGEEHRLWEDRNWSDLERFYSRLIEENPDNASAFSSRGFNCLNLGRYRDARADFLAALSRDDLDPKSRQAIEKAMPALDSSLQAAEGWAEIQSGAARLEAAKDWAGLEAYYTELSAQKPAMRLYALSSRGFVRMTEGRFDGARADFQDALKLQPDPQTEVALRNGLAEIEQIQLAGRQKAEADLKGAAGSARGQAKPRPGVRLVAGSEGYRDVWTDFAVMADDLRAGRLQAVADGLDRLRPLNLKGEDRGQLAWFEGELLWADRRYDQARERYLEARALVTEKYRRSDILWRLAEYSLLKGDRDQAIDYAEQSAAAQPRAYWRLNSVGGLLAGYGRDREAVGYFQRSLSLHRPDRHEVGLYQDLANAYSRLGDEAARLDHLRLYIDRATDLYAELDDLKRVEVEDLYDARRVHSYLNRDWGLDSYIFGSGYQNGDYSAQMVNELYGNIRRGGLIWQPYAQLNGSLASSFSGTYYEPWLGQDQPWSGQSHLRECLYGLAGLRVYPFPQLRHSLSLGLEQVVKIGSQTENDTRLRLNHFWQTGLDLEPYVAHWPYAIILNQAIYSTRDNDFTAFGEVRAGRSLRLDALDDRLVLTPHASVVWGYGGESVDKGQRWSLEAGPGLSLRKWYREDKYNAPQSSADLTVQYRWGLSHDRQNVLSVTLSNSF